MLINIEQTLKISLQVGFGAWLLCFFIQTWMYSQSINVISTNLSFVCSEKNPHHFQTNASFYETSKAESVWIGFGLFVKHEV